MVRSDGLVPKESFSETKISDSEESKSGSLNDDCPSEVAKDINCLTRNPSFDLVDLCKIWSDFPP